MQTPRTHFQTGGASVALTHSKFASSSRFFLGVEFKGIFTLDLSPFLAPVGFYVNACNSVPPNFIKALEAM
jgi:hypothetical protein